MYKLATNGPSPDDIMNSYGGATPGSQ